MSRTSREFEDHQQRELDAFYADYDDYSDLKAARRFAERLTPEKIQALKDDDLVVIPASYLKKVA